MGSPITFSGFNNIDFSLILNSIMQQATQPLTTLQTQQRALQSQITTLGTLGTRVSAMESAADALGDVTAVAAFAGTSSDTGAVGVSIGGAAQAGHHDVIVTELARAQVTASLTTAPSASTIIADAGTFSIGAVAINTNFPMTLQELANAINGTTGIGVTASIIRTGGSSYRLALTSTDTGAANAFTVTSTLTNSAPGGSTIAFKDFDGDGVSGESLTDNAINASDAEILIDNIVATSSSNTFTDVMPGLTLTALKKDPAATIRVDVTHDSSKLKDKVKEFITSYNDAVKFLQDQKSSAAQGVSASIGRDPLVRQLHNNLRSVLLGGHGTGTLQHLAEIGVEFTSTGKLEFKESMFDAALTTNGSDVRQLLAGTGGAFPAVSTVLEEFSSASGFISDAKTRLTRQISSMDSQIARMQARLAVQRTTLQQEFSAADAAMKALQNQSGSLASFSQSLGSF